MPVSVTTLPCLIHGRAILFINAGLFKTASIHYSQGMSVTEQNDEALMLAYAGGDARAFEQLYQRHKDKVYRYFLRHCHEQTHADDLFQDTWSNLINARTRYTDSAKFTTWLFQIAHNRLIDHFRRQNIRVADPVDEDLPDQNQQQPEQLASQQQSIQQLYKLIGQLPQDQRDAFLLHQEAGLTLEQIAETTGTTRETVKSRLRYAIQKLKQGMEWPS